MSTNYTENFDLCQWEPTDQVLRTDFNADNAKIDAALAGKADASALASLTQTVSGKASQSALSALTQTVNALSSTVSGHTSQIAKLGSCELYTTSYTGNGQSGSANPRSFTFPHPPVIVMVASSKSSSLLTLLSGVTRGLNPQSSSLITVSWSGSKVTWYASDEGGQMNVSGYSYRVFALLDCG